MSDNKQKKGEEARSQNVAIVLVLGLPIGIAFGVAMDNLAIGIALGLFFGVALGAFMSFKSKK